LSKKLPIRELQIGARDSIFVQTDLPKPRRLDGVFYCAVSRSNCEDDSDEAEVCLPGKIGNQQHTPECIERPNPDLALIESRSGKRPCWTIAIPRSARSSIVAQRHAVQGAEAITRFERTRRGCNQRRHPNTATLVTPTVRTSGARLFYDQQRAMSREWNRASRGAREFAQIRRFQRP
jgi:hypothetical protein